MQADDLPVIKVKLRVAPCKFGLGTAPCKTSATNTFAGSSQFARLRVHLVDRAEVTHHVQKAFMCVCSIVGLRGQGHANNSSIVSHWPDGGHFKSLHRPAPAHRNKPAPTHDYRLKQAEQKDVPRKSPRLHRLRKVRNSSLQVRQRSARQRPQSRQLRTSDSAAPEAELGNFELGIARHARG